MSPVPTPERNACRPLQRHQPEKKPINPLAKAPLMFAAKLLRPVCTVALMLFDFLQ